MLNVTDDAMTVLENAREKEIDDPDTCIRITMQPGDAKTFNFTFDTAHDDDTVVPGTDDKPLLLLDAGVAEVLDGMSLDFGDGPDGGKGFAIREQQA